MLCKVTKKLIFAVHPKKHERTKWCKTIKFLINNYMNFLALIPARYASSRFPGKPLAQICGKTMIEHVYAKASAEFEHCFVATDDSRIENKVRTFGSVIMTRNDHQSGTDRCAEALEKAELLTGIKFDVVVNIQGDEPFISGDQLEMIKNCFSDPKTDIATLVKPFSTDEDIFNPNSPKVVLSTDSFALYFSRSVIPHLRGVETSAWQANHVYYKHIGMYAYRADVLRQITKLPIGTLEKCESLEQLRWIENGYKIKTAITNSESIAIDTPEDLQRAIDFMAKNL